MKVYCKNCRYFVFADFCHAPTGMIIDNYIYGKYKERLLKTIYDKEYPNRNGDCNLYKRKWWKFWIKEK